MEADEPNDPTDEVLMARLCAGDETALSALMGRWERPVKSLLYRLLLNSDEAAELAQEAFVRLFFNRSRFRSGARFGPWLLTIAANLARNRRRWWRRHPAVSIEALNAEQDGQAPAWEPTDPTAGPEQSAVSRERAAAVRSAVAELPHDLREVVVLSEFEELPRGEIAAILGCTTKAVEMRLYRARERLRRSLGRSGL